MMRIGLVRMLTLAPLAASLAASVAGAQEWEVVAAPTTTSLRGVSAPAPGVVWVSGAGGAVARSIDDGVMWQSVNVPGADSLDFRDIAAFDENTATVLSIGNGDQSRIYRTTDGGASWALQFSNPDSDAFYDCMAFRDRDHGIAMSDPVDGRLRLLLTDDGGATWRVLPPGAGPATLPGEAGFAASGTCVATDDGARAWIVTGGGPRARVLRTGDGGTTWEASDIPSIRAGAPPRGAFSVAWAGDGRLVATGGDYEKATDTAGVVALSGDGGATWRAPRGRVPGGYRSGVAVVPGTAGRVMVAVGTSGSDYSLDGGDSWIAAGSTPLNAVAFRDPRTGWAVGPRGRVVRWRGELAPETPRRRGKDDAP